MVARVEYTIHIEVARVCPLVTTIVEDTILQYIRPEDPDYFSTTATSHSPQEQAPDFYVDPHPLSFLLGDLLAFLGMDRSAYTLFLLNPKSPFASGDSSYGYRAGLSTLEMRQLYHNDTLAAYLASLPPPEAQRERRKSKNKATGPGGPSARSGVYYGGDEAPEGQRRRAIQFSDFTEESSVWAEAWLERSDRGTLLINPACFPDDHSQVTNKQTQQKKPTEQT